MERDLKKIRDLMDLKVKQVIKKEKEIRRAYKNEKLNVRIQCERQGSQKLFKRIIERISRQSKLRWSKGQARIEKKVKWQAQKINKRSKKDKKSNVKCQEEGQETITEWAKRMATEDRNRKRIVVTVPVFGNVTVDREELDALSLNPKFTQYQEVQLGDVDLEKEVCNTKIRWKEQEKVYKRNEEEPGNNMRVKISITIKDGKVVQERETPNKPMFSKEKEEARKSEEQIM